MFLVLEISANPTRSTSIDGLENPLRNLVFESESAAKTFIQEEQKCTHLLYSPFLEELWENPKAELWLDMALATKAVPDTCESCDCEKGEEKHVAKQDDVNSAAVVLTKDFATGQSAFDPSASGGKKELRGKAFLLLPGAQAANASCCPSANRVKGVLAFIKEILPYFDGASGMSRRERDELVQEEIENYKAGVWQPQETEFEKAVDIYETADQVLSTGVVEKINAAL
ncbi:unnamed protein product [Amoebophrya sp. A120]|nr:unnamed protein product [Amoebophrya sp. A120]|eukprot:GSA120T00014928001.1